MKQTTHSFNSLPMQLLIIIGALLLSANAFAATLQIVSGGGYKKPMREIISVYQQVSGQKVDVGYGNMRQILSQTKASSKIALVIGDKKFLSQPNLFSDFQPLGEGKLVIAWAQNSPAIEKASDLTNPSITRIAQPHAKKAIYGRAAQEWIKSNNLTEALKPTLIQAATVPQVSSYLVAREIDAGFINLTDAIGLGERIGGYKILDEGYNKINIVAGVVKGHEQDAQLQAFRTFLHSKQAHKILKSYGL